MTTNDPASPEAQLIQTAQPWAWRKLLKRFFCILLLCLCLFTWAMHRPWGEPVSGVRLEPKQTYSMADVAPGGFYDLLQQIGTQISAHKRSEDETAEYDLLKRSVWKEAELPHLSDHLNKQLPAVALFHEAANQPLENCFVIADKMVGPIKPRSQLLRAAGLLKMLALRDIEAGMTDSVVEKITDLLRMSDRYVRGADIVDCLTSSTIRGVAYDLILQVVERHSSPLLLDRLEQLLEIHGIHQQSLAEALRFDLQSSLEILKNPRNPDSGNPLDGIPDRISILPKKLRRFAFFLGCTENTHIRNWTYIQSQFIQHVENNSVWKDPAPIFEKHVEIASTWRLYLKPDPATRLLVQSYGSGYCGLYKESFERETKRQVTLAVLALHRYYLTHQAWPEKLEMATKTILLNPFDGTPLPYRLESPQRWVIETSNDVMVASDDSAKWRQEFLDRLRKKRP